MLSAGLISSLLLALAIGSAAEVQAQGSPPPAASTAAKAPARPPAIEGVRWSSLSSAQQTALKPLAKDWDSIDSARKEKWVTIANRFPNMSADDRSRVQARMEEWAKLTPKERGQARMNFREAQQMPAQERKDRWEAYKALSPEEQKQLASRAAPVSRKASSGGDTAASQKSNVVPNSSLAPRPQPVAPTVTQAAPGATTNLITKAPVPPAHQQSGMPKIAASPGFVDQSTLLPKRGPQGAATRPSSSRAASGSASSSAKRP